MADANRDHDWRISADFAQVLITRAGELYAHDTLAVALQRTVYALDSTTQRNLANPESDLVRENSA